MGPTTFSDQSGNSLKLSEWSEVVGKDQKFWLEQVEKDKKVDRCWPWVLGWGLL